MALKIKEHDSLDELEKAIKVEKYGRYRLRLQTILLAKKGVKSKDIKSNLMISSKAYCTWVHKYNNGGKEALKAMGSGRVEGNPKWDKKIFEALFKKLDDMAEWWSVLKMQEWINEEYGDNIPTTTIEYHLHKNNYSWKSNRPSPYKGDEDQKEEFKKKASRMWLKS